MKTTIWKKLTPIAVFVLGISGAFFTASMQSAAKAAAPIIGYVDLQDGGTPCDLPVACDDQGDDICRQFGDTGPQAWAQDSPTTCKREVYKPD